MPFVVCTTEGPVAIVTFSLIRIALPFGILPFAAAWIAWRRPGWRTALVAILASTASLLLALHMLSMQDPGSHPPLHDPTYRFRVWAFEQVPYLLGGVAALWAIAAVTLSERFRLAATSLAAVPLVANLAIVFSFLFSKGC